MAEKSGSVEDRALIKSPVGFFSEGTDCSERLKFKVDGRRPSNYCRMSQSKSYTSKTGEVPCGDKDLYAFLTDIRNFKEVMPASMLSEWKATPDKCSFRVEKAGKVTVSLKEALPHTRVSYTAENLFTGNLSLQVIIESLTSHSSKVYVTADMNMNPFFRMLIGESAPQYLDRLIDMIVNYDGYDKIRGYSQSL